MNNSKKGTLRGLYKNELRKRMAQSSESIALVEFKELIQKKSVYAVIFTRMRI